MSVIPVCLYVFDLFVVLFFFSCANVLRPDPGGVLTVFYLFARMTPLKAISGRWPTWWRRSASWTRAATMGTTWWERRRSATGTAPWPTCRERSSLPATSPGETTRRDVVSKPVTRAEELLEYSNRRPCFFSGYSRALIQFPRSLCALWLSS